MLLYLVKHSPPNFANDVCQLSKALNVATQSAFKEMKWVIKFRLDTKTKRLKLEPIFGHQWFMEMFLDSKYGGNKDTRISVGGFIFLVNVPILRHSKAQCSVTLSLAEAEYIALSEAAKEIKFVYQLLVSMEIKVTLLIIVHINNMGAIFLCQRMLPPMVGLAMLIFITITSGTLLKKVS